MAEEEKDQQAPAEQEEQPEEQPELAAEVAAEEPAAQEPAAEEQAAEEAPAEEPAAEAPAAASEEPAEAAEQLSPRQARKLARSRADGPAGPQRTLEDRLRERAEERSRKAKERSRWRQKQKEKKKSRDSAGITGEQRDQVSAAREATPRKTRQGIVVSSKADKTITVRIDRVARHRVYGKVLRETGTLHAHDESNEAREGDVVRVIESRPLSRTKRWRLAEVLEKAR